LLPIVSALFLPQAGFSGWALPFHSSARNNASKSAEPIPSKAAMPIKACRFNPRQASRSGTNFSDKKSLLDSDYTFFSLVDK
jgi:hypothetical protein